VNEMPMLDPIAKARADALMSIKRPENLEKLRAYASPEIGIAIYGIYPAGVGPASVIGAYLTGIGRDVTSHTYRSGDRLNKRDIHQRKVLAVKESALTNGILQVGEAAEEAIRRGYISPDDFRLLIADTFTMLTADEILQNLHKRRETPLEDVPPQ